MILFRLSKPRIPVLVGFQTTTLSNKSPVRTHHRNDGLVISYGAQFSRPTLKRSHECQGHPVHHLSGTSIFMHQKQQKFHPPYPMRFLFGILDRRARQTGKRRSTPCPRVQEISDGLNQKTCLFLLDAWRHGVMLSSVNRKSHLKFQFEAQPKNRQRQGEGGGQAFRWMCGTR